MSLFNLWSQPGVHRGYGHAIFWSSSSHLKPLSWRSFTWVIRINLLRTQISLITIVQKVLLIICWLMNAMVTVSHRPVCGWFRSGIMWKGAIIGYKQWAVWYDLQVVHKFLSFQWVLTSIWPFLMVIIFFWEMEIAFNKGENEAESTLAVRRVRFHAKGKLNSGLNVLSNINFWSAHKLRYWGNTGLKTHCVLPHVTRMGGQF